MVGYTKLYSHREKVDIGFGITNEKNRLFLNVILLRWCHKLPDGEMYWETTPDTFVQARSDSLPRNTFERILRSLFLCDNKDTDKWDKSSMFLPLVDESIGDFESSKQHSSNRCTQQKYVTQMHYHLRQATAKKGNAATLNSAHQAKMQRDLD